MDPQLLSQLHPDLLAIPNRRGSRKGSTLAQRFSKRHSIMLPGSNGLSNAMEEIFGYNPADLYRILRKHPLERTSKNIDTLIASTNHVEFFKKVVVEHGT
jgi:hypothetical protein